MTTEISSLSPLLSIQSTQIEVNSSSGIAEKIVTWVLRKSFFAGFGTLDPAFHEERRNFLIRDHDATIFECINDQNISIDALYIPSKEDYKTENVIVFVETTFYQKRFKSGFDWLCRHYLKQGADVVVWNPTKTEGRQFASDLLSLLHALKKQRPEQKIAIKAHCATVEIAIAAAADLQDDSTVLVLDRGYGNTFAVARDFSVMATFIEKIIRKKFSCDGMQKLTEFKGKIIFIAPEDPSADQIVYARGRNLTYEMKKHREDNYFNQDVFIKLGKESDHWSRWLAQECNQISEELSKVGIVAAGHLPGVYDDVRPPRTFRTRNCIPIFGKAWC